MNRLAIHAATSKYDFFYNVTWSEINANLASGKYSAIIIDERVLELYSSVLVISAETLLIPIKASEEIKNVDTSLNILKGLIARSIPRSDTIAAIGGGVIQDVVTFAASVYMRGINWVYYPTTLLGQSDSCIGGKSSLNFGGWKNVIGNFYNPEAIVVQTEFLQTLAPVEIRSGIGEIIKVHMLSGQLAIADLERDLQLYYSGNNSLDILIIRSIKLKNEILKVDALDKGIRLHMNYGHSFGHALESATNYGMPHGIAVTIGIDMANYFAYKQNLISYELFIRLRKILLLNLKTNDFISLDVTEFFSALTKDKKNKLGEYGLILPISEGKVELMMFQMSSETNSILSNYFEDSYGHLLQN